MTVRVQRTFDLVGDPERVWEFIADPAQRARAISVVADYSVDGTSATWHIELPIPVIRRTFAVETEDVERDPPTYVKFVGKSRMMRVVGEHEITTTDTGCRVDNRFTVDGRVPGIERYFEHNFDAELANLEQALKRDLEERP